MKIALLGAESTGKTTLGKALHSQLGPHCSGKVATLPEVLREFCRLHGRTPHQAEQAQLVEAQRAQEQQAESQWQIVIADSTPLATAIYSDLLFKDTSLYPRALAHQSSYQLCLITWPDFPWHPDPEPGMRDGPTAQHSFHARLLQRLDVDNLPHLHLRGSEVERTKLALAAILALIR